MGTGLPCLTGLGMDLTLLLDDQILEKHSLLVQLTVHLLEMLRQVG